MRPVNPARLLHFADEPGPHLSLGSTISAVIPILGGAEILAFVSDSIPARASVFAVVDGRRPNLVRARRFHNE